VSCTHKKKLQLKIEKDAWSCPRLIAQFDCVANATDPHARMGFALVMAGRQVRISARNELELACVNGECTTGGAMPDEQPVEIELRRCLYPALCSARSCRAKATTIARSVDAGGRPMKQYELCYIHANQVAERERAKGRKVN